MQNLKFLTINIAVSSRKSVIPTPIFNLKSQNCHAKSRQISIPENVHASRLFYTTDFPISDIKIGQAQNCPQCHVYKKSLNRRQFKVIYHL